MRATLDGRVFEITEDPFVFTHNPLIVLRGLTEYRIDGEPVDEKRFRKEIATIVEHRSCEACGDCIRCYGEDRCFGTDDGIHVEADKDDEPGEDLVPE